jgi:glycosyltransferase involved in cell wall biosynthesis
MKLIIERSVTVITPTVGSPKLADAIRSVQEQTYSNIKHLIVVDGVEYWKNVMDRLPVTLDYEDKSSDSIVVTTIPFNTGANGFNGQRIYASIPHLVNSDYVFFLDEDNWYQPDHVATLVETIEKNNLDWAHSLRKIYTPDKQYITDDNCESLGRWPIYFTHNDPQYLVDTSSYAFTSKFIQKTCHLWHSGAWGEDRRYFYAIVNQSKWGTNGKHTLCYRVDNNPKSVSGDFFIEGNKKQLEHYKDNLPWLKT